jgi:hypothetical protein
VEDKEGSRGRISKCSRPVSPGCLPVRKLYLARCADRLDPARYRPIVLKRPDADYLIAFQYFDTDNNGQITFDEFKEAFSRVIGSGSESIRESRREVSRRA